MASYSGGNWFACWVWVIIWRDVLFIGDFTWYTFCDVLIAFIYYVSAPRIVAHHAVALLFDAFIPLAFGMDERLVAHVLHQLHAGRVPVVIP